MKKFSFLLNNLCFYLACFVFVFSSTPTIQAEIIEIKEIARIRDYAETDTLFLLDIDDTVIDLPCLHLGGPAWRDWADEHLDDSGLDFDLTDALSLYFAKELTYKPVETSTVEIIQELQAKGATVLGYTARGRDLWCLTPLKGVDQFTHKQLLQAGIDFTKTQIPQELLSALDPTYFYQGVIYSARIKKGELLQKLFRESAYFPKRVVFVDDRRAQVESVEEALTQLGIPVVALWYRYVAIEQKAFNPTVANVQLAVLLWHHKFIEDEPAEKIAKGLTGRYNEIYLNKLVREFGRERFKPEDFVFTTLTTLQE